MSVTLLYGRPAPGLVEVPPGAVQVSPLAPGAQDLADLPDGHADQALVLAPGGTLERDHVLAQALRVLKPGAPLTVFAPKDKGGSRLRKALEGFGCEVAEDARRHHRFCHVARPEAPVGLAAAIDAGAPRRVPALAPPSGMWSQPGVFSWDRIDPGSARLLEALPTLAGRGADLGCGVGVLAARVLAAPAVTALACVDLDRRAVACARRNLDDPRVDVVQADARRPGETLDDTLADLDFVVMNPPFHDGGREDRDLGVAFVRTAARVLRKGGACWLVANRHLPYEAALHEAFARVDVKADAGGYKILEARK
ncbi:class I SAM-dependent methyltransferase [Phenylobacterium sp. SCN 70-31]|uniref:class I SAM-dependent methyltransferase n=1 Tax=Phenylobacterium sp. SCN 70-31 TaxID=1660129 RepID=UPI00086DE292|nr:class I SAM-dependent methyltransferase [Phenylobacterium sp. SCN 70-31]ODT85112.1 MAG: methyltransferase [Phenylobacterium sp. SCN 70-31]